MLLYVQTWLPLLDNHFDCCDLLRRRVIHFGARKGVATIEDRID